MRYFAKKLNLPEVEQDYRYVVGLLHDVDRDVIGKDPEKHLGEKFEEIVNEMNFSEAQRIQFLTDIRSHYPSKYPDPEYAASTPVRQYLLAIDELSGLMYAYARMRGGSFDGMEVSGVMKKIKDLKFAAGVDREHVKHCEMYLGIPLEEFV
jgi:predicted hydrolase (HD superfamily)